MNSKQGVQNYAFPITGLTRSSLPLPVSVAVRVPAPPGPSFGTGGVFALSTSSRSEFAAKIGLDSPACSWPTNVSSTIFHSRTPPVALTRRPNKCPIYSRGSPSSDSTNSGKICITSSRKSVGRAPSTSHDPCAKQCSRFRGLYRLYLARRRLLRRVGIAWDSCPRDPAGDRNRGR